jgi:hypothetical protein
LQPAVLFRSKTITLNSPVLVARTTPYCITSCLALLLGCSAPSSPTGDPRDTAAISTGSLQVLITGVPEGAAGAVVVTGPGPYRAELPGSTLLTGLVGGEYTISAAPVAAGGDSLVPSPPWQRLTVPAGDTPEIRSVGYGTATRQAGALNLRVDGMYLTQATQVYAGSVPLVAGREAYLRVFVLSDLPNTTKPEVRVRLYHGSLLMETHTIPAPGPGVPSWVSETVLSSSWNLRVPGALVQPGLRISAEVDPWNTITETSESDNRYPATSTAWSPSCSTPTASRATSPRRISTGSSRRREPCFPSARRTPMCGGSTPRRRLHSSRGIRTVPGARS